MSDQTPLIPAADIQKSAVDARTKRGRIQMLLLLLVCASPVIASYITFYLIKPSGGQNNYGQLVYPVQESPKETLYPIVHGKWTMLLARPAATCETDEQNCLRLLHIMRQVRAAMGKERQRLQIVWVVTDQVKPSEKIRLAYDDEVAGVKVYSLPSDAAQKKELLDWINVDQAGEKIQLIDPTGARMMRFSVDGQSPEFPKMKKDLEKLLKWNPTGKYGQ
jgi:hypothetical protein